MQFIPTKFYRLLLGVAFLLLLLVLISLPSEGSKSVMADQPPGPPIDSPFTEQKCLMTGSDGGGGGGCAACLANPAGCDPFLYECCTVGCIIPPPLEVKKTVAKVKRSIDPLAAQSSPVPIPTDFQATLSGCCAVNLSWKETSMLARGFVLERSTDMGATFKMLAELPANQRTYVDNASPNTSYCYRIKSQGTKITFQLADGASLPDSSFGLRIGMPSRTNLHKEDRKTVLRAIVDPASALKEIDFTNNGRVFIKRKDISNDTAELEITGLIPSNAPGDTKIAAIVKSDKALIKSATLTLVIPAKFADFPTSGVSKPAVNIGVNENSIPAFPELKKEAVFLITLYPYELTIKVVDKWDNPIGDLYAGALITERRSGNNKVNSTNVFLSADSTYTDVTGAFEPRNGRPDLTKSYFLVKSDEAMMWKDQDKLPYSIKGNNLIIQQEMTVAVDGYDLPLLRRDIKLSNPPVVYQGVVY